MQQQIALSQTAQAQRHALFEIAVTAATAALCRFIEFLANKRIVKYFQN